MRKIKKERERVSLEKEQTLGEGREGEKKVKGKKKIK
jgi:hypothetical protein